MMAAGVGWRMGRGYTIFDAAVGRCGIVWSDAGIVAVHLPEVREIDTRRRVYQLYPDARETRPPMNTEIAIDGIATLLRGEASDLLDVTLDTRGIHVFNQRVYEITRGIPAGKPAPMVKSQRGSGRRAPRIRWRRRSRKILS